LQLTVWTDDNNPSLSETILRVQKEISHVVGVSHFYILLFFCPDPLASVNQVLLLVSEGYHYQQQCEQNVCCSMRVLGSVNSLTEMWKVGSIKCLSVAWI